MIQETFPLSIAGEEIPDERSLLTQVESGLLMDPSTPYATSFCTVPPPAATATIR